ncbi:MAG: FliO/MopB family protein [Proteobacteria bacterium]|nr:FliO/MopB family protein [Pseudomonadota bacterium]
MSGASVLNAVLMLVFVVGLIALLAWAVRRLNLIPGIAAPRRGGRRLQVVEVTPIDIRRKLVLVRRDDREHLLLLGQASELVIESGIVAGDTTES